MNLFQCEKRHKFYVSICVFDLPIFVAIYFVNFACHFEYRVYSHAKSLQSKSIAKIGFELSQKMQKKLGKKVQAKIGTLL